MTEKWNATSTVQGLSGSVSGSALMPEAQTAASGEERVRAGSEKRIASSPVRELCGGISDMTLWRWLNNPELGFPKPTYIVGRRYWREADIIAWLEAQASNVVA